MSVVKITTLVSSATQMCQQNLVLNNAQPKPCAVWLGSQKSLLGPITDAVTTPILRGSVMLRLASFTRL